MINNRKLRVRNILAGVMSAAMVLTSCSTTALATDEVLLDEQAVVEASVQDADAVEVSDLSTQVAIEDTMAAETDDIAISSEIEETESEAGDVLIVDTEDPADDSLSDGIEAEYTEDAEAEMTVDEVVSAEEAVEEIVSNETPEDEILSAAEEEDDTLVEENLTAATVNEEVTTAGQRSFFYTNFKAVLTDVTVKVSASNLFVGRGATMVAQLVSGEDYIGKIEEQNYGKVLVGTKAIELSFLDAKGKEFTPIGLSVSIEAKKTDAESYALYRAGGNSVRRVGTSAKPAFEFYTTYAETYIIAGLRKDDALRTEGKRANGKTTFSLKEGGADISVTAPSGAFYGTISMEAEMVSEDAVISDGTVKEKVEDVLGKEVAADIITAYDISFHADSKDDVEPNKEVTVTINLPLSADGKYKLIHIPDEGATTEVTNAVFTEKGVTFTSKDFSVYAVVESGEDPTIRATYIFQDSNGNPYFFVNDAGETVDNQIIKDGEYLEDVGRPDIEPDQTFTGWFVWDQTSQSFGTQVLFGPGNEISVVEEKEYIVRPALGDVAYLSFYEDSEGTNIYQRIQVPLSNGTATFDISTQSVTAPKSNLAFLGWSETPGEDADDRQVITNTNVLVNGNKSYYPVYKSAHWIHFHANPDGETGASYTAPRYVLFGASAASAKPADPTWKGHSFQYWSETKPVYNDAGELQNNPQEFSFEQTLDNRTSDVELYAVWENDETTYTVIFWKQKVTDSKSATDAQKQYDYAGQETQSANSGSTVSASDFEAQYTGFTVNESKSDDSIQVNWDGSSVLNVYFDRKLLTMQFYKNGTTDPGYDSGAWTNGNGSQYVTTYTGLYGQTLAQNGYSWPEGIWTYYTTDSTAGMSYLGQFKFDAADGTDVRDPDNVLFRAYQSSTNSRQTFRYYLEQPDGTYVLKDTGYAENAALFTFTDKYDGYTIDSYQRYKAGYYYYVWEGIWIFGNWVEYYQTESGTVDSQRKPASIGSTIELYNEEGSQSDPANYRVHFYSMDVYYRLETKKLKFLDSTDSTELKNVTFTNEGANAVTNGVGSVKYTASLSPYRPPSNIVPISQYAGKVWDGRWYIDKACTTIAVFSNISELGSYTDIDQENQTVAYGETTYKYQMLGTMPNADMAIYAGWTDIWYRVEVDPNGGVLSITESTYFWLKYGEVIQKYEDVKRNYIEDANGTYSYFYNGWNPSWPDSADGDPKAARIARYSTDSSITIAGVTINPDSSTKYKYQEDVYSLVGWYKVNDDDSLGEPYDFSSQVTSNVKIRAVWRVVGEYKVVYDLDAVDEEGNALADVSALSKPSDNNSYADKSQTAMLGKAGVPDGYIFGGWYYDGKVYNPGDVFTIKAELADSEHKVHVKPVLIPYDSVPVRTTHIYWYANNGTDAVEKDEDLQLNKEVLIRPADTFSYEGYTFKGWGKSSGGVIPTTPWLEYDAENNRFILKEEGANNNAVVTHVAADEIEPYDDLYAIWEKKTYTVTVKKIVNADGDVSEHQKDTFTFVPTFSDRTENNFTLSGTNWSTTVDGVSYNYVTSKTFEDVPYGTTFSFTENDYNNYVTTVSAEVSGDIESAGPGLPESITNGTQFTANGDITITFTNTLKVFYVYHSGVKGGNIETVAIPADANATYNLTQNITAGKLYGGYYLEDGIAIDPSKIHDDAEDLDGKYEDVEAYTGEYTSDSDRMWAWNTPQEEENGMSITPEADTIYFIKEVPGDKFLKSTLFWTYTSADKIIHDMWFITALDDTHYNESGFEITIVSTEDSKTRKAEKPVREVTFEAVNTGFTYTKNAENLYSIEGDTAQIAYWKDSSKDYLNDTVKEVVSTAYWVTPDNCKVTAIKRRRFIADNGWLNGSVTTKTKTLESSITVNE